MAAVPVLLLVAAVLSAVLTNSPPHPRLGSRPAVAAGCAYRPTRLSGVSGHGYSATFSPDGSILTTGYDPDGITYLWNGTTDRLILAVTDPRSQGSQPAVFSPDGKTLATADINGSVYLWSTATHKLLATLGNGPEGARLLFAAAFSPDGAVLAADDTEGGYVYLWNTATDKLLATLGDQSASPSSVAFLPDGKTLAVVEGESSTYLWDIATRSRVGVLTDPGSKGVYWVAVSPDGRMLATADGNGNTYTYGQSPPTTDSNCGVRLVRQADARRETAPWTFHVAGPDGAGEVTEHEGPYTGRNGDRSVNWPLWRPYRSRKQRRGSPNSPTG